MIVPSRWRHSYSETDVSPQSLPGMEASLHQTRVAFPGRQQRHFHLVNPRSISKRVRPDVAFVEAEPFSVVTFQWWLAFRTLGIPFGVQCYENIDRDLPAPVAWLRSRVLRDAAFVAARSATAGRLARSWGARGAVELAPPAVPGWQVTSAVTSQPTSPRPFTVGYAGRLVASKGLSDLLAAVRKLDAPVELLLLGNGELREDLDGQPIPGSRVRVLDGLSHDLMPSAYAQVDVIVLPSHTTAKWKEQFGRVIVEALWCGVPVVGSDSGEIPWLIELTKGGLVFPEGDHEALADRLRELRESPQKREALARVGREAVERMFSIPSATDPLERMLMRAADAGSAPVAGS